MRWIQAERTPSLSRVVAVAAALLLWMAAAFAQSTTTQTVTIKQMRFEPSQLTIKAGDTVEWKNEDIFTHTVTADDQSFESGPIAPGKSWKTTFQKAATVGYHCTPHPNMKASLQIGDGAADGHGKDAMVDHGETQSLRLRIPTKPEEIHPILVNFTAALLPLALLSDILGLLFKRQSLHNAAWWMVLYDAALTPLTALAGWWWKSAAGPDLPQRLILVHQWLGTSAVLLFAVLAIWRWKIYKRGGVPGVAYLLFAFVAVLALVYQGSLGGAMVFGN